MPKNDKLINSIKTIAKRNKADSINKATEQILPQIYAALAIALHREYHFGCERIERVFRRPEEIWTDFTGTGEDMIRQCEEETGAIIVYGEKEY